MCHIALRRKKAFSKKIKDKLSEKDYSPTSMTDLAGIRVITLIEADVQKVCNLISSMFNVHTEDSINKSEKLGEEKVGYRSVHFVCDVGKEREKLPEFSAYKGLCFEIQVRTALEHAWAEIEHDRGYKLIGKLPSYLNRRFKLLSGLLESADMEFNRLTVEIEDYKNNLNNDIEENKLDYELTTVGINQLINNKYKEYLSLSSSLNIESEKKLIQELESFGIETLNDLDKLINRVIQNYKILKNNTILGLCRDVMMLDDINKYFQLSFLGATNSWGVTNPETYTMLKQKYEEHEIDSIFSTNEIDIIEEGEE